ncbi:MAG TPA: ATP-binding protein [Candidatus Coprosoma intestinipullorum]|uniref:ATP-binding protein n=1 Tax=Candidatus Coprosoma intestinipullorum TaxID=2840752 RepID=A0A9D0ZPQ9_9FIRM|nr:ATP-binding protein [Candidatus Coprosoma intestinipullorum]
MIKVITGIRRCGKSYLLKTIIEELKEKGVKDKDIIYIELDSKTYKNIKTPEELEKTIDNLVKDNDFKYLFIDEVQNVKGYEKIINAYREEENFSIFLTGSNSYLLSGELMTKLTGRYIEIEMLPLNFYEYVDMKKFLNKKIDTNIYREFEEFIREGGFPGSLKYDTYEDKLLYTRSIIEQIFNKDIRNHKKIKDKSLFEVIQKFVIGNFGSIISVGSIYNYLTKDNNILVDRRTIKSYIEVLENAKIIYPCDLFDIKSKKVLEGEKKYYLADLSIYYALNTDNRINYGPVLENVLFSYLKSRNYSLSVGKIGNLECDFIARRSVDEYFYIQVSKNIDDKKTEEREYKPFYEIKEMYPRYLFTSDMIFQKNVDGIHNVNIVDFIYKKEDLK